MKKLDNLKLLAGTKMNDEEMKKLRGGFDCGSGLTYYVGACTDGTGFSICARDYPSAHSIGSDFCTGSGY